MRSPIPIVVQLLVSVAVVALVMPLVMLAAGPAKERSVGLTVAAGLGLAVFFGLRRVWPARRD